MSEEPRDQNAAAPLDPAAQSAESNVTSARTPAAESPAAETAAAVPPVAPPERPKPAYGEYAPEGWSWTPPVEPAANADDATGGTPEAGVSGAAGQPSRPSRSGQVSGVPHNLGARGTQQNAPGEYVAPAPVSADQASESAPSAPSAPAQPASHYQAAAPLGAPAPPKRGSADRVISILLLVIGAFGALNMALSSMTLPESFNIIANAAGLDDFVVPSALNTLATVGAIIMLAIYAVNLILTIQRIRARRLTFWVPLVAAVLSFIAMMVLMFVAVGMVPDLVAFMSDPDSLNVILDRLYAPVS